MEGGIYGFRVERIYFGHVFACMLFMILVGVKFIFGDIRLKVINTKRMELLLFKI
jgi:hypothetical protein